jgi:hypothetical protein
MSVELLTTTERLDFFGKSNRYTAKKLYYAATQLFQQDSKNRSISLADGEIRNFLESKDGNIILPPATDIPLDKGNDVITNGINQAKLLPNGGFSVNDALTEAKKILNDNSSQHVFIPIVQTRGIFFGFGPKRQHFTYLQLDKEGDKIKATHIDSKGFLGRLYPLDGIREAIKNAFPTNTPKLHTAYTGQQGLLDDHNCGRYTMASILHTATQGIPPRNITQENLDKIDISYKHSVQTTSNPPHKQNSKKKSLSHTSSVDGDQKSQSSFVDNLKARKGSSQSRIL